jgi:aryl-alcohol dehydrogenase-like predicted oxidoreductase
VEQRLVGRSGLRVSRLGLGTLTWGRDTDAQEAAEQYASRDGKQFLDTRPWGRRGRETSGPLKEVVRREEVVLCSKAGVSRRDGARLMDPSRRGLLADLDRSLHRLRTDHLDLWLVHGWSAVIPLEETLSALENAVSSGRVRYVGISTTRAGRRRAALLPTLAPGLRLVAAQVEYSLVERGVEREVVPAVTELGLGMLAWSPLGRGVLTGKYRTGTPADSRGASPHLSGFVGRYLGAISRRVVDAVVTAADGLGCSPLEVALAWLREREAVSSALVGARTAAQLEAALASEDVELPAEIRLALDEVSAPEIGYPERF